jgi:putative addiction module component (TIGR02574 family)
MKTITVCVHNDKDAELLKKILQTTKFNEEIETYEEEEEFTGEDIAEFDRRAAEYDKDPSKGRPVDDFLKEMKKKHGI